MGGLTEYYIVATDALPLTFTKVIEAKALIENGGCKTASEALKAVGISRSAYYRYKDKISPLFEKGGQSAITVALNLDDVPGYLSEVLTAVAESGANILTINQTIPINRVANITMTVQAAETDFIDKLRELKGVRKLKILARG